MAEPFESFTSRVITLPAENVDTDQIVPARFLKVTDKAGLGEALFRDWRFEADGSIKNPAFVLDRPEMAGRQILLAGDNFGCGSSREHAPWALADYGFRAIIAPSFADIFYGNCCQNGLLPVVLPDEAVSELFGRCAAQAGYQLAIDLRSQTVGDAAGFRARFEIDAYRREMLLRGLDEIGRTLLEEPRIAAFERRRAALKAS